MRTMDDQRKRYAPFIWAAIGLIIVLAVFFFLIAPLISPTLNIGIGVYAFEEELRTEDNANITKNIPKNALVAYRPYHATKNPFKEGDLFAYYEEVDGKIVIHTEVFESLTFDESTGSVVYTSHPLDSELTESYTIPSGHLLGIYVGHVPNAGIALIYLAQNKAIAFGGFAGIALLLVVVPILVGIARVKPKHRTAAAMRRRKEEPNGPDFNAMPLKHAAIFRELCDFMVEGGMVLKKSYNCYAIYVGKVMFGIIEYDSHSVLIRVNKNFSRYDGKIDRAGYIRISNFSDLDYTKLRINSIYNAYFRQFKPKKRNPGNPAAAYRR